MARSADAAARVRAAVLASDGLTRAELADRLRLPLGTVTSAAAVLLRARELTERPRATDGARGAGRPPVELVAAGPAASLGAVVWSPTRVRAAVLSYGGAVLAEVERDFGPDFSSPEVLDPALRFVTDVAAGLGADVAAPDRIVLGVPSPFQRGVGAPHSVPPARGAAPADDHPGFAPWLRPDPAGTFAERTGLPIIMENDANLGALGEARTGAGRGYDSVVYLKLGERSIGAGLVFGGELFRGASGFAGEIAHIHLDDEGPLCRCGARGCLSTRFRAPLTEVVQPAYDHPLTFSGVLNLAVAGEPGPKRVLRDLGRTLGRPLADLCTFLNPAALVVDGAFGAAGGYVRAGIEEQIERYAAPAVAAALHVLPGQLGAGAELAGAVELARAEAAPR